MIKALISDFDGVLFDSEAIHFKAANQVLGEMGLHLSDALYQEKYLGLTDYHIAEDVLRECGLSVTPNEIKKLIDRKMAVYKALIEKSKCLEPIKGVDAFLSEAQKYFDKFAICSNANRADLELVLNKLDHGALLRYFKFIVTANDVKQGKPAPEGYLKAAQFLEVDPKHCLVVEDSVAGIRAAKSAEMTVVALTTTYPKSALQQADYVAHDYSEITRWLQQKLSFSVKV